MSTLLFDGLSHQLSLIGNNGEIQGTWIAYNNVDRHATLTHVPNRTYTIQDRSVPLRHTADANGSYGLHGIIRFNMAGHPGIGVHSGRAHARHQPGPQHQTMGCIRTSDEAMLAIAEAMQSESLSTIEVRNNSAPMARTASRKHKHRRLPGSEHAR